MNHQTDTYKLSNGVGIPCIGFGTWQTPDGDVAVRSVAAAIEAGYRHIDTAQACGNEESVGKGILPDPVANAPFFHTDVKVISFSRQKSGRTVGILTTPVH